MRGFSGKRILAIFVSVLAVCLWAQTGVVLAQKTTDKPVEQKVAPIPKSDITLTKEEKQSIVNELRRELIDKNQKNVEALIEIRRKVLDDRANTIDWWLTGIAIFFAAVGVVGYMSFRNFQEEARKSADAAKEHAEEAKGLVEEIEKAGKGVLETFGEEGERVLKVVGEKGQDIIQMVGGKGKELLEEIRGYRDESKALFSETAENFAKASEQEKRTIKAVLENPESSPMEKAVAKALSLQEQSKKDEAVEAWRSIANVMQGVDDTLAAGAWFSIGYLCSEQGKHEDAIEAYSRSVDLKPNVVAPYNNRGNAKGELNQYEAAIKDFDKAISLNPDYAEAYINRGNAKDALGQLDSAMEDYDRAIALEPREVLAYYNRGNTKAKLRQYKAAIADFDEVLVLKPDDAITYYNRGIAKAVLDLRDEARDDLSKARELAPKTGDENLIALVEQELQKLSSK